MCIVYIENILIFPLGVFIYAFYGIHHSLEGSKQRAVKNEENKNTLRISS